nr:uncharacterized protein CI109_005182 [Kwoniella shandongensis]KAA5526413.1 hypothetical protein CI109_005182 [Kwoniella shandongensis]
MSIRSIALALFVLVAPVLAAPAPVAAPEPTVTADYFSGGRGGQPW